MDTFKDRVAIVTGGGSGIGRAVCSALGSRGACVTAADVDVKAAERTAADVVGAGGQARAAHLDVTRAEDVRTLVDQTRSEYGRLDFMFNNAGIGFGGEVRDMTLEQWRRVFDVNLWGVVHGATAAYSVMVDQGFGHIVNTASIAGLLPGPFMAAYCASKHAVVGFSTSLRAEADELGVRVSVVCPGYVNTPIFDTSVMLNVDRRKTVEGIPFKKIEPSDAARAILSGVERNEPIIVFPFHASLMWRLFRLHPESLAPLGRKLVRDLRTIRTVP